MDARTLTWPEVKQLSEKSAVALLPVGSTEAHGPHLPLSTDVVIAEEVCRRVDERLAQQGRSCVRFPAVSYGLTDFAAGFAGTISIRGDTLATHLQQVVEGIVRHGFRVVALVNHHVEPAHFRRVHDAAKTAAASTGAQVLVPDHRKGPRATDLGAEFMEGGGHAGSYETSLVLAANPTLVREPLRAQLPDLNVSLPALIKEGRTSFEACGGKDAYFGSPRSATAETGERLYGVLVDVVLDALDGLKTAP